MKTKKKKKIQRGGFIKGGASWSRASAEISDFQLGHAALQGVAGPVLIVPAQEPPGEGGRLVALLDFDDGRPVVPVGRVRLDVTDSWGRWRRVTDQRRKTTPTSRSDLAQKTSGSSLHSPDAIASVFSSSWASFPIQTNTWKGEQASKAAGAEIGKARKDSELLYLLPGVEDHDIIGGEIILGQLPWNLLDLEGRGGGGGLCPVSSERL